MILLLNRDGLKTASVISENTLGGPKPGIVGYTCNPAVERSAAIKN